MLLNIFLRTDNNNIINHERLLHLICLHVFNFVSIRNNSVYDAFLNSLFFHFDINFHYFRVRGVFPVYNYVSSPSNAVPWKYNAKFGRMIQDTFSIQQSVWYFSLMFIENSKLHGIAHFFLHKIPGIILDKIAVWNGQKARYTSSFF